MEEFYPSSIYNSESQTATESRNYSKSFEIK